MLDEKENGIIQKQKDIQKLEEKVENIIKEQIDKLEKISGFSKKKAKEEIMKQVELSMSAEISAYIKEKEAERIVKAVDEKGYLIALAIHGKTYDSVQFSEHLEKLMITGNSHIQFVIGGSLGLSDRVLKLADEHISFSQLTFPHQLMRVILAEQIYRAYRIMNHEPYHK